MKAKLILHVLGILMVSQVVYAQEGTIRGRVIDSSSKESLYGAAVFVAGTTQGTSTDFDGKYTLTNVPAGKVKLVCQYISYQADTQVVEIKANQTKELNFGLGQMSFMINNVNITAKVNTKTEGYARALEKKAPTVMNVLGAEQIAKGSDGDAASALKRLPGASVEGGKYVYVRGLSDRYSKTTLNGAEIPGLDPNRNSVQVDLFPTNLIENMSVVKSFSPDLPGSFTGGLVNITTKDYPSHFTLQYGVSLGYNRNSNLRKDFLSANKGKTDWMGFDDGTRAIPTAIGTKPVPDLYTDNDLLQTMTRSFNKELTPVRTRSFLDQGYSFSIGNKDSLFGKEMGYIAGITYGHGYQMYQHGETGRYTQTGSANTVETLNKELLFDDTKGQEEVTWGALASMSLRMSDNDNIGLMVMRNQDGINSARYLEGEIAKDAKGLYQQTRTLGYKERSITSAQLKGQHLLQHNADGFKMDWLASYTHSTQIEPDLRFVTNDYRMTQTGQDAPDTLFSLNPSIYGPPSRYFRDLEENNIDTKVNFELPVTIAGHDVKFKSGLSNVQKHRNFGERRFDFRFQGLNYQGDMEAFFADENMDLSTTSFVYMLDASERRNSYIGNERVSAAYVMGDVELNKFRIITGLRFEQTNIDVKSLNLDLPAGYLKGNDLLPALNVTYFLKKDTSNLRFACSRTLARPTFRELAPFASFDFVGDYVMVGNLNLERTLVDNLDLRWELYPSSGEVISFGVFGKRFQNPIERAFNPVSANPELNYRNVKEAIAYGAEVEVRRNLSMITPALSNFNIGGNLTLVKSSVSIDKQELANIRATNPNHPDTREMFGQAPYVVNATLGYTNDSTGISANLNYNVSGPRLAVIVVGGTPNVYEQPAGQLDFNLSKKIGKKISVKLDVKNILNPVFQQTQTFKGTDYVFQSYRKGLAFKVGFKCLIQ